MTEDDYFYLYVKYNEYKSKFANGEFKPSQGGDLGYAMNLRYMRRDRHLEKISRYYVQQCSHNIYFYEKCDDRFLTNKRSVMSFTNESFTNNKQAVDRLMDAIKNMIEEKQNNTADDLHTRCRLSYGFGDKDIAFLGCSLATAEVKYFPEFEDGNYLYSIVCIYAPFIPKKKCYDWTTDKEQVCESCPPEASPCRKSLCV